MKEIEYVVSDSKLAEEWFCEASESMLSLANTIKILNFVNGFDLFNNDEDLPEKKLRTKRSIKNTNICTPLAYDVELMLKSVIILYKYKTNPSEFSRENKNWLPSFKKSGLRNGHDIEGLISFINTNFDSNFILNIASNYGERREESTRKCLYSPNSVIQFGGDENKRLQCVIDDYKNGFIDFRYLFEKSETIPPIDLTRLLDYAFAIREICFNEFRFWGITLKDESSAVDKLYDEYIFKEAERKREEEKIRTEFETLFPNDKSSTNDEVSELAQKLIDLFGAEEVENYKPVIKK